MPSVSFDAGLLAMLPPAERGLTCSVCDKPQSVWQMASQPELTPVCSICVLYKVPWKGKSGEDIELFIRSVEDRTDMLFERDSSGNLLSCKDADRLVGSLVLVEKMIGMAKKAQK